MANEYKAGEGVTFKYDSDTGSVEFYSDGGTLWPDWIKKAGISRKDVQSIRVAEGTVKLPEDASGFDKQKMVYTMFGGLVNVESIDLKGTDTSRVTNMFAMFFDCVHLKELDISSFDTSNVTNMIQMFLNCCSLKELDMSSFDISNVKDISGIFTNCERLTRVRMTPTISGDAATYNIFRNCSADII